MASKKKGSTKKDKKVKPEKNTETKEQKSLDLSPEIAAQIKSAALDGKDKIKKIKDLIAKADSAKKFLEKKNKFSRVELMQVGGGYWVIEDQEINKQILDLINKIHEDILKNCKEEAGKLMESLPV